MQRFYFPKTVTIRILVLVLIVVLKEVVANDNYLNFGIQKKTQYSGTRTN